MIYTDTFRDHSFKETKARLPLLQERVFRALASLTPMQLQFALKCQSDTALRFNWSIADRDTFFLIGAVVSEIVEDPKLILTQHDMLLGWARFKELIYTYELLRQGILVEQIEEDGSVVYVPTQEIEPAEEVKPPAPYKAKARIKKSPYNC